MGFTTTSSSSTTWTSPQTLPSSTRSAAHLGLAPAVQDTRRPSPQQRHIEERLGKLESQASTSSAKITKEFDSASSRDGTNGAWLTRDERNVLRKFMFILKYRGSRFHKRFAHETGDGYFCNDRELMQEYMGKQGYKRPIDVWVDGLGAIMDRDIDLEYNWGEEIAGKMVGHSLSVPSR
jgi:hypothetical protein